MRYTNFVALAGLAAALVITPVAADAASLTIDAPQVLVPGGSVDVSGTLTLEPGDPDPLFLNGISINLSAGPTFDDTPFFTLWPLQLDSSVPGTSNTFTGVLFTVFASSGLAPGPYTGSVTIQGGNASDSFDEIAVQSFEVTVRDVPPPPVPEPATLALVGLGLAGLATRRKATR